MSIYFKGGSEDTPAESRMSHILISDKARESKSPNRAMAEITKRHESVGSVEGKSSISDSELLPCIAILAGLDQQSSFSVTFPERESNDHCLRICAASVDATTYPFLAKCPALTEAPEVLVRGQRIPELETPVRGYPNAQVRFDTTSVQKIVVWEHGRTTPEVRR